MLGEHPAIQIPQSSKYAEEMRKWEAYPSKFGPPGRPYQFREFPKMLYRASRVDGKGIQIVESQTVHTAQEEAQYHTRGFRFGQDHAIQAVADQQKEYGTLAAEREWQIRHGRVSEKAAAEVRAAEEAHGATHMPDVPVTPIKKRGRPVKVAAAE